MAIISKIKQPIKLPIKNKIAKDFKSLFVTADAISVAAALRLVAINDEIAVLEAEKITIKSITSDIQRYNLGTGK